MFRLIFIFITREKRNLFINKWTIPTRLFIALLDLYFYYFAAKAFIPSTESFSGLENWSLFEFVAIGEIVLTLAIDSLVVYPQQLRRVINECVFDTLLNTNTPIIHWLTLLGISSYLLSFVTILFQILCLAFIFKLDFSTASIIKTVILNVLSLPLFISFGLLSAAILLYARRGVGLFGTLVGSLGVLSGAYFPLEVFPSWASMLIKKINPFSLLLSESRLILKTGSGEINLLLLLLIMIGVSIGFVFLSHLTFQFAINRYKTRGEKLLLGH